MCINYLLSIICLLACLWLFPRLRFVRSSGLSAGKVRLLLMLKISAAAFISFYLSGLPFSDYVGYNAAGTLQYQLLKTDPVTFFSSFGDVDPHSGITGMFSSAGFWADIRFSIIYKTIALLNLITGGNFYFNSMLFSALVFFGQVAFYKIFLAIYPGKKKLLMATCFLLPSLLVYTSCVHKDGLVFLAMAALCYVFLNFLQKGSIPGLLQTLVFLLASFTIFLLRNYVLVALLPALFTAALCRLLPFRRVFTVVGSYAMYAVLFFLSGEVYPPVNLPQAVVQRKADFALLEKGNTTVAMNNLEPTFTSFLVNMPQAINHTTMRPYLWESRQPTVVLVAVELFAYQLLLLLFLFYRQQGRRSISNFNVFGLLFFFSMMLIIGYSIPNLGAIVRYRSIFLIFLLCPLVCNIDWQKFRHQWFPKGATGH